MLTLAFSALVASTLTWIPGAASSHAGFAGPSKGGTNGCVAVSLAIRSASRPHKDSAGRNTSVEPPTNERSMGATPRRSIALLRA